MGMLKKAVHLFRESARERWGFTVFSVVLFFVVSCIEYLIYVGMIYAVFWALGTKSVEGMAAVALVCAAVAILGVVLLPECICGYEYLPDIGGGRAARDAAAPSF